MRGPLETIVAALDRQNCKPKGGAALCPAHEDKSPSLTYSEGSDGRALLCCHKGCSLEKITDALRLEMSDLFNEDNRPPSGPPKPHWVSIKPVPTDAPYPTQHPKLGQSTTKNKYLDAEARLLGYVLRWDTPTGKEIRPLTFGRMSNESDDCARWGWRSWSGLAPLYGLDLLTSRSDAPVIVTEGEKAAGAAQELFPDCVAITSPGGSKRANKADWSPLKGRSVTIWPDADEPGRRYADDVARLVIEAGAKSVRVVEVPENWPDKWDLADDLPDGVTGDDLLPMVETAVLVVTKSKPDLSILNGYRQPAPGLPVELFGEWARWITDAGESTGSPVDYIAGGLLALMAGSIGNSAEVSPWLGWREPALLWVGTVGDPGSGKSPAIDPLRESLAPVEKECRDTFENNLQEWESDLAISKTIRGNWEQQCKAASKAGNPVPPMPEAAREPQRPPFRRIRIGDATPEAIGAALQGEHRGLLCERDELAGWLGSFGRYSGAAAGERALWLEAYGARPFTIDRVKAGHVFIPRLTVSILGSTQPERLNRLLLTGEDDGLSSRFLWVWPDPRPRRRPRSVPNLERLTAAIRWARSLPMAYGDDGSEKPQILVLDNDAAALFEEWWLQQNDAIQGASGLMASALAKGPGLVLRLSLVLSLADAAYHGGQFQTHVEASAVARAIALWEEYFVPMAVRVFGDAALPQVDRDARVLARWIAKARPTTINARDLRRNERLPGLKDAARMDAALDELVESLWLIPTPSRAGDRTGRQRKDFAVNPELLTAFDRGR